MAPFTNPNIALVYGKQRGNKATKYSEYQIFTKWVPNESNLYQDYPFCNNANAAIRRGLWKQLSYNENLTRSHSIVVQPESKSRIEYTNIFVEE